MKAKRRVLVMKNGRSLIDRSSFKPKKTEISHYGAPPSALRGPSMMTRPQTFDQFMNENEFPRISTDETLAHELFARNQKVTPNEKEQEVINNLVARTKLALESIAATDSLTSTKIREFREVGSYKKGTMITRNNVADLVVMLQNFPKPEDVKELGEKVIEQLKAGVHQNDVFGVVPRDFGCEIAGTQAVIRLLVAIPSDQLSKLEPGVHCKSTAIEQNLAALRHAYWFDENAGQPTIKMLIRLIKDVKSRCTGLAALDVWTIELLCHYCVTCTPDRNPLPMSLAFRRFFQLIASGFLLHTSIGVADPCDPNRRINYGFGLAEADLICRTAQFITRLLVHGQYDQLLAIKFSHKDLGVENESGQGVNIAPLQEVYNKDLLINLPLSTCFHSRLTA